MRWAHSLTGAGVIDTADRIQRAIQWKEQQ